MGESKVFYVNMCFVCHLTIKEKCLKICSSCKLVSYCSEAHQKIHWKHHRSFCKVFSKISSAVSIENIEDNYNFYKYRTNLLMLCELEMGRMLKPCEVNMILFPNHCQICHKKSDLKACLDCLCVSYCSEDHKQADFTCHKDICHLFALCVEVDLFMDKTFICPNDFLWECNFTLPDSMNKFIESNVKMKKSRDDIIPSVERAILSEFLTCPLSLLFALSHIQYLFQEKVVIHVVGCSTFETTSLKSWESILHINPQIQNLIIHFIGPEVKSNDDIDFCETCKNKLAFKFFSHYYHDYVKSFEFQKPDIICCFNCGFHEFEYSEVNTWDQTLPLLVQNNTVPLIFSSFTQEEAKKDSKLISQVNETLNVNILKNKFSSLRPYRDLESLGIFFNNNYITVVLNKTFYDIKNDNFSSRK